MKILVTKKYNAHSGSGTAAANRVTLIREGERIAGETVFQIREYDPNALNLMRQPGAMVNRVDRNGIEAAIAALRAEHPEFANAPIQDNSVEANHG